MIMSGYTCGNKWRRSGLVVGALDFAPDKGRGGREGGRKGGERGEGGRGRGGLP